MKLKALFLAILLILCCLLAVACDKKDKNEPTNGTTADISESATKTEESTPAPETSEPTTEIEENSSEPDGSESEEGTTEPIPSVCPCTSTRTEHENVIDSTCKANGSYDEVVYCVDCNKELSHAFENAVANSVTFEQLFENYEVANYDGDFVPFGIEEK